MISPTQVLSYLSLSILVLILTALTQIGGLALLLTLPFLQLLPGKGRIKSVLAFLSVYLLLTFLVIPQVAPLFGRERIRQNNGIQPTRYFTVLLNRNYVRPELNALLARTAERLDGSGITISYLDANFPFFDGFPLLPHLSHNDGRINYVFPKRGYCGRSLASLT